MRRLFAGSAALAIVLACSAACDSSHDEPCVKDLRVGDRLKVTILDRYDVRSTFAGKDALDHGDCYAKNGLAPGAVLVARINRPADGTDCVNYLVDWESFGSLKLELVDGGIGDVAMVGGEYIGTGADGCRHGVSLGIRPAPPFPLTLPLRSKPGGYPEAVLDGRMFGCLSCSVALVVDVEKL